MFQTNYFLNGELFSKERFNSLEARKKFHDEFDVKEPHFKAAPKATVGQLLKDLVSPIEDEMEALPWKEMVRRYDRYSLRDFLRENNKTSAGLQNLIGTAMNVETIFPIGLLEFIIDECLFQKDLDMIEGGMDRLPRAFLQRDGGLKDEVVFNSKVTKVSHRADGAKVYVDCRGVDCPLDLTPSYETDYVIVTSTAPATLGKSYSKFLLYYYSQNNESRVENPILEYC